VVVCGYVCTNLFSILIQNVRDSLEKKRSGGVHEKDAHNETYKNAEQKHVNSVGRRRTTTLGGTTDVVLTNLEGSVSDAHRGIVLKCTY
jgi:hypothetical protein